MSYTIGKDTSGSNSSPDPASYSTPYLTIFGNSDLPSQHPDEHTHQRLYVTLVLLVALLLRLYHLSSQSIWVDEMLTLFWSGFTAPLTAIDIFGNLHGPLHTILVFLWTRLAGESEFALRFPSVVFSVLSLIAIYRLILKLSDSRTALIAMAVIAFSPFHIWYAQEARNYSMLLFFSTLSFESFLSLLSQPDRNNFGKYVLLTFAAFLSNMSMAFVVIVQDIFFFVSPRKLSFRSLFMAHILLALLLLPWLIGMYQRVEFHRLARTTPYAESEFLRGGTTFTPFALPYTFFVFSVGYSLGPSLRELHESARLASFARYAPVLVPTAIAFALAFLLGIISFRNRRRLLFLLLLWIALPLAILSFFGVKNFKPFNPRYLMVSYPAYVLLLAEGLRHRRPAFLRLGLGTLILVTMLLSLWNYYNVTEYAKDDFRSAARTLETEFVQGDVLFTEGTYEPLIYYGRRTTKPITFLPLYSTVIADDSRLESYVLEKSREANRIWLMTSRLWDLDPEMRVPALFRRLFVTDREFHYEGVDLLLLSRR